MGQGLERDTARREDKCERSEIRCDRTGGSAKQEMEQSQYRHLGHCNHGWELKSKSREEIGQRQKWREDAVEENLRSVRS